MKFTNTLVSCGLLLSYVPAALAHDFWLEPGSYSHESPSSVAVQFKVGHEDSADHWNLTWSKIVALRNYTPTGVVDMAASIIPKSSLLPGVAKSNTLDAGSYVIGFESYHSLSTLEAEKFNQYAEDEGLKEILEYRDANGLTDTPGTELYSRKAKTIVQIGTELSDNATAPVGHTLEIVPVDHPFGLEKDGKLKVQVLFRGKPLQHASIDAMPLNDSNHKVQALKTDSNGNALFRFSEQGPVKLNVIWGVPLSNNRQADFETYFSSLTFTVNHKQE